MTDVFEHLAVRALVMGALFGCAPEPVPESEPDPIPVSTLTPGLALRGGDYATFEDHLVELLVHEGHVYVANSTLGVSVMSLDENGGVALTDVGTPAEDLRRCTSVALHAPSDTLYCGSDAPSGPLAEIRLEVYDVATPGSASWLESFQLEHWGTRDLVVIGDRLLIHHFDGGLWTAQIDGEGALSQLSDTGIVGNARVSVSVDGQLVTLLADAAGSGAELRLYDPNTWTELDRLPLSGPALGLSADAEGGAQVAVGLGSGGMAVVAVEGQQLHLEHTFSPPAVVTTGLISGDLAIAVTLSGAFGWDLADSGQQGPRMFGFAPSAKLGFERAGNMLHGVIHDGELLTSDWLWIERWSIDRLGEVLELDVPRGIYVQPEGPVRWRMRNPGATTLRTELWFDRESRWAREVGPGELIDVEISAELRAELLGPDEPSVRLGVRFYDPSVPSEGEPVGSNVLALAQRQADDLIPPATGDLFPTLTLADPDQQIYTLPTPEGSQTIWFWPDCAMMWPELEDLAWLGREGWDLGRGEPILLTSFDVEAGGFATRWALDGATFGLWGVAAPGVGDANDHIDEEDIYRPFFIHDVPGDAMPTDFVMDAQGVVLSVERMYRGPWTLVVPWPWE